MSPKKDFNRDRLVWERTLDVDYKDHTMWLKYADVEMKNKLIMPGIANSTKSSEGSRKISPRFASSPDTTQKSSPGLTTRKLKTTRLEVNSSSPKKPSIKIPKSTSPIISASHLEVPFMRFGC